MAKQYLQNWGNYPKMMSELLSVRGVDDLKEIITKHSPLIARGNGRCYGDSALQETVVSTLNLNKIIFFDKEKGILCAESGVLLSDILELVVPVGYFLPVSPGTKWITLGGAVAANIHGKNHHKEGAISNFVLSFNLMLSDGTIVNCSPTEQASLFVDTIGGMGMTGIISTVTLQLKFIETAFIKQKTLVATHLSEVLDYFEQYRDYTYSVAWIDCLKQGKNMGRSILMLGEHATRNELIHNTIEPLRLHSKSHITVPFYLPSFILNKFSIALFNAIYYRKHRVQKQTRLVHYDTFFYPLDRIKGWNKIYGKSGFVQYQFVIPFEHGYEGLHAILNEISRSGCASFLAVLKTFGPKDSLSGPLSFPCAGYTLALDFKISAVVLDLLNRLDELVLQYRGKIYLAKDARMSKEVFKKMYPKVPPIFQFQSSQTNRLC
jgi:FAD/FMN-containing dehydrogenase